jgi:hypothetical protein
MPAFWKHWQRSQLVSFALSWFIVKGDSLGSRLLYNAARYSTFTDISIQNLDRPQDDGERPSMHINIKEVLSARLDRNLVVLRRHVDQPFGTYILLSHV